MLECYGRHGFQASCHFWTQLRWYAGVLLFEGCILKPNFSILGQGYRRDFSYTAKCPQWPHLYKSYEATYVLKCLFFVKIAKNRFFLREWWKISFLRFYRKISILGYMLLHNSYINVAIANILLYRKSLYDLPRRKCKITNNRSGRG